MAKGNLKRAASRLASDRHVDDKRPGRIQVIGHEHDYGSSLSRHTQVGQPYFTVARLHACQSHPAPPVQSRDPEAHQPTRPPDAGVQEISNNATTLATPPQADFEFPESIVPACSCDEP